MSRKMRNLLALVLALLLVSPDLAVLAEEAAAIRLPSSLKVIEDEAFYGDTSIEKVIVPEGATEIGERAFANSSLTEINLPDSITSIADTAFDGLDVLKVTANEGSYAYNWASENDYIYENVVLESEHPYKNGTDQEWTYTHPKYVRGLRVTFSETTELESPYDTLTITDFEGNSTTYTGRQLAGKTLRLEGPMFTILLKTNSSTRKFGFQTTSIEPMTKKEYEAWQNELLFETDLMIDGTLMIREYTGDSEEVVIPSVIDGKKVSSIRQYTFSKTSGVKSVVISDGITSILGYAFWKCRSLKNIVIPNSVTSIGAYAFDGCSSLNSIVLPDGITLIGEKTFNNCYNLKTFPSRIVSHILVIMHFTIVEILKIFPFLMV